MQLVEEYDISIPPVKFFVGELNQVLTNAMNRVASAVGEGSMAISFVHKYLAEV